MPRIVSTAARVAGLEPVTHESRRFVVPCRPMRIVREGDLLDAMIVRLFAPSILVAHVRPAPRLVTDDEVRARPEITQLALRPFITAMARLLALDMGATA